MGRSNLCRMPNGEARKLSLDRTNHESGTYQAVRHHVRPIGQAFEDLVALRELIQLADFHIGDISLRKGVFRLPLRRECFECLNADPSLPVARAELRVSHVVDMRLSLPPALWQAQWLRNRCLLWSNRWLGVSGPYWLRLVVWDAPHFLELRLSASKSYSIELEDLEIEYTPELGRVGAARIGSAEYLRRSAAFVLTPEDAAKRAAEHLSSQPTGKGQAVFSVLERRCRARIRWVWGNSYVVPLSRKCGPDSLDGLHVNALTGEVRVRERLGRARDHDA